MYILVWNSYKCIRTEEDNSSKKVYATSVFAIDINVYVLILGMVNKLGINER